MNHPEMSLRLLGADQIQGLDEYLSAAGLPAQDFLQHDRMFYFFSPWRNGIGSIEGDGQARLIRSLGVGPAKEYPGSVPCC
ncbi:hypothetical protein EQ845_12320 [Pseudomonas putida]|uniref:hypothetical protein n=1 Tax=Pseudomonas putida TaxID=303 RepID=UPI00117A4E7F|nr:hypothetical protein [Pseudomonas putida]MDI9777070.1 hypothetical protein [Pseudomonas putida]TRO35227.1 hypothetical protein EQ845_12320 [Pseudomonas putida]